MGAVRNISFAAENKMEVQIKITKEQHEMLLERLGNDEAIHTWMQDYLNDELRKAAERLRSKKTTIETK